MAHPLFFCTGVVRSGSTWSFNVVRMLSQYLASQRGGMMGSAYIEGLHLEQFLQTQLGNLQGPTVIKAHGIGPRAMQLLHAGQAKAVCTVRDPRDCIASDLKFLKKDINFSIRRVLDNMHFLNMYEGGNHTLFVQYEQMMANPLKQITRIAGHLGIDANESILTQVESACCLESSKVAIEQLKQKNPSEVMWLENHRVDPNNHLHENHIYDAKVGKWKDSFSVSQADRLTEIFKPWLVKFGYEAGASGSNTDLNVTANSAKLSV